MTQLLVNGKQVTVGTIGIEYALFSRPIGPAEVKDAVYSKVLLYFNIVLYDSFLNFYKCNSHAQYITKPLS